MTRSREEQDNYQAYLKEHRKQQANRKSRKKDEDEKDIQESIQLREKFNISPKERATYEQLVIMIGMVLDESINGTKAIRKYAEAEGKTRAWIDEIAKPKVDKRFKSALQGFEEDEVVIAMKNNNVYDEKDILNNTVTGALTKLSKQLEVSKLIDDLRNEVATLKKNLADRTKGEDWKPEALRLHVDENMSYRKIAEQLGVSKTSVANYLKDK